MTSIQIISFWNIQHVLALQDWQNRPQAEKILSVYIFFSKVTWQILSYTAATTRGKKQNPTQESLKLGVFLKKAAVTFLFWFLLPNFFFVCLLKLFWPWTLRPRADPAIESGYSRMYASESKFWKAVPGFPKPHWGLDWGHLSSSVSSELWGFRYKNNKVTQPGGRWGVGAGRGTDRGNGQGHRPAEQFRSL